MLRSAGDQEAGDQEIEVGPMLEEREGNVFRGHELRRICARGAP